MSDDDTPQIDRQFRLPERAHRAQRGGYERRILSARRWLDEHLDVEARLVSAKPDRIVALDCEGRTRRFECRWDGETPVVDGEIEGGEPIAVEAAEAGRHVCEKLREAARAGVEGEPDRAAAILDGIAPLVEAGAPDWWGESVAAAIDGLDGPWRDAADAAGPQVIEEAASRASLDPARFRHDPVGSDGTLIRESVTAMIEDAYDLADRADRLDDARSEGLVEAALGLAGRLEAVRPHLGRLSEDVAAHLGRVAADRLRDTADGYCAIFDETTETDDDRDDPHG